MLNSLPGCNGSRLSPCKVLVTSKNMKRLFRLQLLLLLLLLLRGRFMASAIQSKAERCLKQDSSDSSTCPSDSDADVDLDSDIDNKWVSPVQSKLNEMSTKQDSIYEDDDDFAADFEQIMTDAQALMEDIGKDMGIYDELSLAMHGMRPTGDNEGVINESESMYSYPPLTARTVKQPGEVIEVDMGEGETVKMIARSVRPLVFEVPNFLTYEECDIIISAANNIGLKPGRVFKTKAEREANEDLTIERKSHQTLIYEEELGKELLEKLQAKVAKVVDLPVEIVQYSRPLAVLRYDEGGYLYAHMDSSEIDHKFTCCFQTMCLILQGIQRDTSDCCRKCRFATLIHYLNDVDEGGETVFPMADVIYSEMADAEQNRYNLTESCLKAPLRVKPVKGTTLLFYNHFIDNDGYLGPVDSSAMHGSCTVRKGKKWIASQRISAPDFSGRNRASIYVKGG